MPLLTQRVASGTHVATGRCRRARVLQASAGSRAPAARAVQRATGGGLMVLLIDQKPGAWLTWKIRELAELLKRIPNDRRRAFAKYLKDAPGATLSDDDTILKEGCELGALRGTTLHALQFRKMLRVTPAMEVSISNHVWSLEEIVGLSDRRTEVAA